MVVQMIVVMIIMFVMLVLTRVMFAVVNVLLLGDTLEVGLELALALALRQRAHLHVDVTSSHLRLLVGVAHGHKVALDLGCEGVTQFLVSHLAPTELKLDAHFVTFSEEVFRVDDLDQVVMRINADAELELLQLATLLVLVSLLLMLFLDILVLTVIHDFAHGRLGIGSDLDEVKPALLGHAKGLLGGQNAILLVGDAIHHAHLGRTDALIDAGLVRIPAVVALGAAAAGTVKRGAAACTGLISPWGGRTVDRCAGRASGRCPRSRLRRGSIIGASTELSGTQVIEWIANG
jgi:hypothetical protein